MCIGATGQHAYCERAVVMKKFWALLVQVETAEFIS